MTGLTPIRARFAGLLAGGLIAFTAVGGVAAASPAPATAPIAVPDAACATQRTAVRSGPTVANLIALGDCEIARRFTTLDRLGAAVAAAPYLTTSDRSSLQAELASTRNGLQGLKATIDADTTIAALRAELPKVATDYRVYLLVVPQVHLTRGADAEAAAIGRLTSLAMRLQQLIDQASAQGRDVSAAKTALASMQADIAAAQGQVTGLSGRILALTPADWNSGSAAPVLSAARAAERSARDELAAARDAAKAVIAALR